MARIERLPTLIEGLNHLAAALAHNLTSLAPGNLQRVLFTNSGSEVVDASIKLARAATGRKKMVACQRAFHGRTIGALSMMDRRDFRDPFEPLLEKVNHIPFGDLAALQVALRRRDVAGFLVEPIQGEGGIVLPPSGYLEGARELCSDCGTLLIVDEIQTGLARTGRMFAVQHEDVTPDVLLIGKALGGGAMPISAILTTDDLFQAAEGAVPRSPFQTPTFGANARACAAALATLEIMLDEKLAERAATSGDYLLSRLRDLQREQPLIRDVRGRGLMIGVEFTPATQGLSWAATAGLVNRLSRKYFSSIVLMELRQQHHIMTAFTLNNPNVLRLQPPLNLERKQLDYVVDSLDQVLTTLKSFPRAAFGAWRKMRKAQKA